MTVIDVESALQDVRNHSVDLGPDHAPRHYVDDQWYSDVKPRPKPYAMPEIIPFTPPPLPVLADWSEVELAADRLLDHLEHQVELLHPDVVACFGMPS